MGWAIEEYFGKQRIESGRQDQYSGVFQRSSLISRAVLVGLALGLSSALVQAHGHMTYPKSRAAEYMKGDQKSWPIAGIREGLSRAPCIGLKPNSQFTKLKPGPLTLKFLFPDGANHKGYCTAFLYDPLEPEGTQQRISETQNCGRSVLHGAGKKGKDIKGTMSVVIPQNIYCEPAHCVLHWEWTATHKSETNIQRFEHYDSCADVSILGATKVQVPAISAQGDVVMASVAPAAPVEPVAPDVGFFDQDWTLNLKRSFLYLQSVKNKSIFETHGFNHMDGKITPDGKAVVKLDLASFDTGIDLRNVRMRYLFFRTFQFPYAEITAQLDTPKLDGLLKTTSITYPLKFTIDLHGIKKELERDVVVTRIADNSVSVAVAKPIIIMAEDFGLLDGVARLEDAVGTVIISPVASITFDLVFEGTRINPEIAAITAEAESNRIQENYREIDTEACGTRLSVLSDSQSINFRSGSAELDADSAFALDTIVDFTFRCPKVGMIVSGHTDNVGGASLNMALSKERAESVVAYLIDKGVDAAKLEAIGNGEDDPVAPNDTPRNRAQNRRIAFALMEPAADGEE